ncbi:MAG: 3-isopropylmalate dehydratase large subunit [Pseudomonadota bacterium]
MASPTSLFDKLWQRHLVIAETDNRPGVLYIDLHLIHEVTSPQAFSVLEERGLPVRRPDLTLATLDHSVPTLPAGADGALPYATPAAANQVRTLIENCATHGIELLDLGDPRRGIVHVVGPELGVTQPGKTIVCGDSHTSTHGAFGALAFGIGTTEVGHVLATQCVFQRKPRTMRIMLENTLAPGVTAKDMALYIIREIGADGGQGFAIEFAGPAVEALSMEARMTLCNMSIEAGARFGMVAPDETTFDWLAGRPYCPIGADWDAAIADWRTLKTDPGALIDRDITIDAALIEPMVTYGVSPDAAASVKGIIPPQDDGAHAYMKTQADQPIGTLKVDRVFVGSCTNSRLTDLREAAAILKDQKVKAGITMLVVPGSEAIRKAAEAEGLDRIFTEAGAQWRLPGCSMCIAMNGDQGEPGDLVVSTSNRNFIGRQGKDVRTVLASPATAAASAIAGHVADPRDFPTAAVL